MPSHHGSTTRSSYLTLKKLPQIYTIISLLPPLPPTPVEILDVGGGRSDLALNILHHLSSLGRHGDIVTIVDNNPPSVDSGIKNATTPAIKFVCSDFKDYSPSQPVFVTVGLHPCGSLSDEILTRAPTFTTDAVILVPCCYSKCTAECSPFLRQGDDKLFDVCRLCERNDDVQTSETAMRIINDRRVEQARTLKNKWKWDIDIMHRDYTGKNIVIVGRKDDVARVKTRGKIMFDDKGLPLCSHVAWGRKCRWGSECTYSHDVPSELAANLKEFSGVQHGRICKEYNGRECEVQVEVPEWVRAIKDESTVLKYDCALHNLRAGVEEFLCRDGLPLERLHEAALHGDPPSSPTLLDALGRLHGVDSLPESWKEAISINRKQGHVRERALQDSEAYEAFVQTYERFVEEVVCAEMGAAKCYVQRPPTLRIHLAGLEPASGKIGFHRDRDYPNHVATEINFWVPLVDVGGANSLFVEATDGGGDFDPVEARVGEYFRFDGYNRRHHTLANSTQVSRVSIDFRVVPETGLEGAELMGKRKGRRRMRIGDYPAMVVDR